MKTLIKLMGLLAIVITMKINAQIIVPPTNVRASGNIPCWNCVPAGGWFNITGTPDMSNRTNLRISSSNSAASGTWNQSPLTLPPNNHNGWITIRDVGNQGTEEAVGTMLSGLTTGEEYEIVVYSMTAIHDTYSKLPITQFTFRVTDEAPKVNDNAFETKYPRTTVTNIKKDTEKAWSTSRLRFKAVKTEMYLALYPGSTATSSATFKSVNLSITANSVNTLPVVQDKTATTKYGQQTTIDVISGATDKDAGQQVVKNSVDLNPSVSGIQKNIETSAGTWIVDNNGIVTFSPKNGFYGTTSIQYTAQDNYTLDGNSSPGTSAPKTITVNVMAPCTESVNGTDFSVYNGVSETFTMSAADYGFQFDVYELDNSFNLTINGVDLATKELEFQKGTSNGGQNIRFKDGTVWEESNIPDIWRLRGTKDAPIIRIIIDPNGNVTMFGSKTSGGRLEELELITGTSFNRITWNTNSQNIVKTFQSVIGTTLMKGYGSGLKTVPCFCTKPANTEVANSPTKIGISTKSNKQTNWPDNIPNGFIALESSNKGFVITRISTPNQITDAKEGMLIYDNIEHCVKLFNGATWKCIQRSCND